MSHRASITVRLSSFEGPLDLLLYLIQSHELNISTVSIGRITDQYLAYIRLMRELNFDTASEFLVMAATLLHWKSKSLLPDEKKDAEIGVDDDGVLSQEDLVRQLLQHQLFCAAGANLAQNPLLGEDVFTRPASKPAVEKIWKQMDITGLAMTFQDVLVRSRRRVQVLQKETVSLADKILDFRDRLQIGKLVEIRNLLTLGTRSESVVTFLASLELSRLRKLKLYQEETYGALYLELIESLNAMDLQLVHAFENVNAQITAAAEAKLHPTAEVSPGELNPAGRIPHSEASFAQPEQLGAG